MTSVPQDPPRNDRLLYEQCDVPPGKTLRQWRIERPAAPSRRRRAGRVLRALARRR